jgi:hypothetical protein
MHRNGNFSRFFVRSYKRPLQRNENQRFERKRKPVIRKNSSDATINRSAVKVLVEMGRDC